MAKNKNNPPPEGHLRTDNEKKARQEYARIFKSSNDPLEVRLQHFPKYIRRQDMTRLLACYEIFKRILKVKGSIVECGVYRGFSLMAWANFSAVLEPNNITRRIYGFDTFEGFPDTNRKDKNAYREVNKGELSSHSYGELQDLVRAYDMNRFLGHVDKVNLVKGPVGKTIPAFMKKNPHLMVSLLFLDLDLYEPTKTALKHFVPRMPRGSIIAFDELDNPIWPGETLALLESMGLNKLKMERLDFDPYIGFVQVEG